jgi:hypothetical protein
VNRSHEPAKNASHNAVTRFAGSYGLAVGNHGFADYPWLYALTRFAGCVLTR